MNRRERNKVTERDRKRDIEKEREIKGDREKEWNTERQRYKYWKREIHRERGQKLNIKSIIERVLWKNIARKRDWEKMRKRENDIKREGGRDF